MNIRLVKQLMSLSCKPCIFGAKAAKMLFYSGSCSEKKARFYMESMVKVFIFGKKYEVPASLTIMGAMEYSGYRLVRGCGCRHGFCGACAAIYRIKGDRELKVALACHTQVVADMYIATLPFFPLLKQLFDINTIKPDEKILKLLYPEIYNCIGCNACTKSCPQELNTMQYIAYAQRAEYAKSAKASFDCVMCGICSSRCPAGISHPQVGVLVRRLYGKYITSPSGHVEKRVSEIENGEYEKSLAEMMSRPIMEIKELYNAREIEQ
jgi:succinate dehydrogenase/fumarate reductase-like Fe-S protein